MLKHEACAAAISSSGFVPLPFSKRDGTEYGTSCSTPLPVEVLPEPRNKSPLQCAVA